MEGMNLWSSAQAYVGRVQIARLIQLQTSILPMGIELSIGVATYPSDGQNMAEIMELADKLMYQEKEEHHAKHKITRIGK